MSDLLFYPGDLSATLRAHREKALAAARKIPANRSLKVPIEDLVEELYDEYRVTPVELDLDAARSSGAKDKEVTVGGWDGQRVDVPGTRVEWRIPFAGDSNLFKLRPSQFTLNPPRGNVRGQTIVLSHEGRAPLDAGKVKSELDRTLKDVQKYLGSQRTEIEQFNEQLRKDLNSALQQRREKVLADRELDAALEIPVERRDDPLATFTVDPPRRPRPAPEVHSPDSESPFAPEPTISDDGFANIVGEIASVTGAVERFPQTFAGMPEESLRDVLLVVLNNRFGPATGETFSRRGKTDIFIPYGGDQRAVFIAECKWWRGPAGFREAIDQLLGYLTWRDTKAALVVFTERKEPTAVARKAREHLQEHAQFKRTRETVADQWTATLHHPDDPNREIHIALIVVPVQSE